MKKILTLMLVLAIAVCVNAAGRENDNKASKNNNTATVVFTLNPRMTCSNCENRIKSNLRFEKGVKAIETSLSRQTVTVRYNPSKATPESIAEGLAKIGYTATVAGDSIPLAKAATPASCKK